MRRQMRITKRQLRRVIHETFESVDSLNFKVAMKIKDMMPPEEALGMSMQDFEALVVSVYDRHFDDTGEGWAPYREDLEEIENHLTIIPLPGDLDYEDSLYESKGKYHQVRRMILEILEEDKSGKGKCPDTGCIKQSGGKWRIISNKTGKLWPQKYSSKKNAESALGAYHASK